MQNKGFIFLVCAVFIVVGYAAYDYQAEKKSALAQHESSKIVNLKKDQVIAFEIAVADTDKIALQLSDSKWMLIAPLEESADPDAVNEYLQAATLESSTAIAKQGDGIQWKLFGLDVPKAKLTFKSADQQVIIEVGSKKNFEGDSYIRRNGENKVLVASSIWWARAEKKFAEFQDKRLMREPVAQVEKLVLKLNKQNLSLAKYDEKWVLNEKPMWHLDQNKVREIIAALNTAPVLERKDKIEKSPTAAPVRLEVQLKDKKSWTADIWMSQQNEPYVQVAGQGPYLKISPTEYDKFARVKAVHLRKKSEAFDFKKDDVDSIDFVTPLKISRLNGEAAKKLIPPLQKLEAIEFLGTKVEWPKEKSQMIFRNKNNQEIYRLEISGPEKKNIEGVDRAVYLVKTNLFDEFVWVDESEISSLDLDKIFEAKEEKK